MELLKTAIRYLKKYPFLSVVIFCSIIFASLLEGASFGMLIPLIENMTNANSNFIGKLPVLNRLNLVFSSQAQHNTLSLIFLVLLFIMALKNIFTYLSSVLICKIKFNMMRDLSVQLVSNLINYDIRYFDSVKTGHLINNITNETMRMGDFIAEVLRFITLLAKTLTYIVLLFLISFKFSIVVFALIFFVLLPLEQIMKKLKKLGAQRSEAMTEYNYKLLEIFSGIRLIKICTTENLEKQKFRDIADILRNIRYRTLKFMSLLIPVSETAVFTLIVALFLGLINVVKIDIHNTFPIIGTYLIVLTRALTQLNALNSTRSSAMSDLAAFANYESIYDEKGKRTISDGSKKIEKLTDSIKFVDVGFSYSPNRQVLKDINIDISSGKITAFVGASGVGKSTLINLILRFYDVDSGKILVDGINLRDVDLDSWRSMIGFVSQDVFIFNTSVRENIAYGHGDARDADVADASRRAFAHDFIMNFPKGYDTVLGERGVKLSGGQKQRISIARAIIHNPKILILDEATSSLDSETERLIRGAVDDLAKDRTVIAIAHRLSTILHADKIIVLEKGRVVERGDHKSLIDLNGTYTRLYESQFI